MGNTLLNKINKVEVETCVCHYCNTDINFKDHLSCVHCNTSMHRYCYFSNNNQNYSICPKCSRVGSIAFSS